MIFVTEELLLQHNEVAEQGTLLHQISSLLLQLKRESCNSINPEYALVEYRLPELFDFGMHQYLYLNVWLRNAWPRD